MKFFSKIVTTYDIQDHASFKDYEDAYLIRERKKVTDLDGYQILREAFDISEVDLKAFEESYKEKRNNVLIKNEEGKENLRDNREEEKSGSDMKRKDKTSLIIKYALNNLPA